MALFKYTGTSDELEQKVKTAGFVYATVDETETPGEFQDVGQWWIDIPSPDGETEVIDGQTVPVIKRFRMAAASLIDENGNVYGINDFFVKGDSSDIVSIEQGGTGASSAADARIALDVYSTGDVDDLAETITENVETVANNLSTLTNTTMPNAINIATNKATTKAFYKTLTKGSWIREGDYYVNEISLASDDFTCGADGTVPPQIAVNDWQDDPENPGQQILRPAEDLKKLQEAWENMQYAQANPTTKMIKFYASEELSEIDIPLIVIDHK